MIRSGFAEIDGMRIYFESVGTGPSLLCIHPVTIDGRIWREFAQIMRDEYSVYALDLPGHGKSDLWKSWSWNSQKVSLEYYGEVTIRLIENLGLESIGLIGCAMGGNIALYLATKLPKRVKCVICYGGAAKTQTFTCKQLEESLSQTRLYDIGFTTSRCGRNTRREAIEKINWLQNSSCVREVSIADTLAWNSFDMMSELQNIKSPVLLMKGEDDLIVTMDLIKMSAEKIENCEVKVLKGVGPWPMIEDPEAFANAVSPFLSRHCWTE